MCCECWAARSRPLPEVVIDASLPAGGWPQDILRRLRLGEPLDAAAIRAAVAGIAGGGWSDAQVGAFAMAVCLRGMEAAQIRELTLAMRDSGACLRFADLPGPLVDKHSTGGIGDNVSLMLGPMLAACGAYVPMISGRGLGHTGGTLDKLEAIAGYRCEVDLGTLQRVVGAVGVAIVGASAALAPADRRLYAIRDVTATVDSIALITASILAKKLAESPQALVLDVKRGSGATMVDPDEARALAHSLVQVASQCGVRTRALLTDMHEPLAPAVGNTLELELAIRYLQGHTRPARLHAVTLALGEALLCDAGIAVDAADARARLLAALDSGAAWERFERMVHALGGDLAQARPRAPCVRPLLAGRAGYLHILDARALGLVVVALGGGRRQPGDRIDHRVGLDLCLPHCSAVAVDTPLLMVHAASPEAADAAAAALRRALVIVDQPPASHPLIEAIA